MTLRRRATLLLALLLLAAVPATATATTTPAPEVVAEGLANPRGLAIGHRGVVWVTEAGIGGAEEVPSPPLFGPGPSFRGDSGRLVRIDRRGRLRIVADGLPSIALGGFEVIGPSRVVLADGRAWVVTGVRTRGPFPTSGRGGGPAHPSAHGGGGRRRRHRRRRACDGSRRLRGRVRPQRPRARTAGELHVADAGGNALYRVDRRTGAVRLVTVFAGLPSALPNPSRGGAFELDPVPTGVASGPDGGAYVGLLSGFPFPSGGAQVVRVAPDGAVTTVADGLTTVVDLAFGRDGALYVLEFASGFDLGPEAQGWRRSTGRILRLGADGSRRVVADGLDQPFGMAVGRRGDVYVTERTNTTPAEGAQGRVLRFPGLAR
jgi:hypothetical protein